MSSSAEWKEAVMSTRHPWHQFLDLSALSLPSSFSEATTRVTQNLTHFLFNYALLLILIFLVSLISHPFPLILFLFLFAAWYFLYFSRDNEPLTLSTFLTLSDSVILACLAVITVVILFSTGVWFNLFLSVVVGAVVACLHAALRSTDDLVGDDRESPYGPMLSDPSGGAYVPV